MHHTAAGLPQVMRSSTTCQPDAVHQHQYSSRSLQSAGMRIRTFVAIAASLALFLLVSSTRSPIIDISYWFDNPEKKRDASVYAVPTVSHFDVHARKLQPELVMPVVLLRGRQTVTLGNPVRTTNGLQLQQERDGSLRLLACVDGMSCETNREILWQNNFRGAERDDYVTRLQQNDGNLVTRQGSEAVWDTGITLSMHSGEISLVHDVSHLSIIYTESDRDPLVLWSDITATVQPPAPSPAPSSSNKNSSESSVIILAYYYPWYIRNDWSRHAYPYRPLLGEYGTDEVGVAEIHNEWALRGGIDAWVVSWGGANKLRARHFRKGMLQAQNLRQMKYCILYESKELPTRNFTDARALSALIRELKAVQDEHFDHPSYLHIDGKPVVILYITRSYLNFERSMISNITNELGQDLFLIADEPYFDVQSSPNLAANGIDTATDGPIFDYYTTYNMYSRTFVSSNHTAKDFMFDHALPVFQRWSERTVFFPNVLPQYQDFRPLNPHLPGDAKGLRDQLELFSCLPRPPGSNDSIPRLLFVTSFNEWWEGSQIEPDESSTYGFSFLDEIRDFKESGPKHCARNG